MSYSDFSLTSVKKNLELNIQEINDFFIEAPTLTPTDYLTATLAETVPLALAINTEKARSELIITPILLEIRRHFHNQISLFSGSNFNVEPNRGLTGYCDFIISHSPEQLVINSPVAIIIEAKNENINAGLGQCIASMVAAQIFNKNQDNDIVTITGAVTTGDIWRFLQLKNQTVQLDMSNIYLDQIDKILGVLSTAIEH